MGQSNLILIAPTGPSSKWIPAFAGMTVWTGTDFHRPAIPEKVKNYGNYGDSSLNQAAQRPISKPSP